jgi:hypothetical protein
MEVLAAHCKEVIGTDVSSKYIAKAREMRPSLHFEVLDGFNVLQALNLGKAFTKPQARVARSEQCLLDKINRISPII